MAYIEVHQSLREHPKTKRAARILNISRAQMVGHLVCLWWWCLDYADDGDLSAYSQDDIADAAEWQGDPDEFVEALFNCGPTGRAGFLIDGPCINDWHDYGGKYITKRNQGRERQKTYRLRNAHVTQTQRVTNGVDKIREDKIREEERIETPVAPAGAPPSKTRTVTAGSQQDMFGAVAETCQLDAKLKQGQIAKQSKALLEAGYTPEQVRAFSSWWKAYDWRGQRGNVPTLAQLAELIKQSTLPAPAGAKERINGKSGLGLRRSANDPIATQPKPTAADIAEWEREMAIIESRQAQGA